MTPEIKNTASSARISEALELLNEAAKEKTDELKELMSNKYPNILEAMAGGCGQGEDALKKARDLAQKAIDKGREKAQEIACHVDEHAHKDPWVYVAGAGAVALVLGYLMGSKRQ